MRTTISRILRVAAPAVVLFCGTIALRAFPPAPDHIFYGMVRDELGNPLNFAAAEIVLETDSGVQLKTQISNGVEPGVNYRLAVPMDAGISDDLYKPTALRPTVPLKFSVRIKQVRYLPIEMRGEYTRLGEPGQRTRLDLTLGEDSDGDGLPDAWERALLAARGGGKTLADTKPGDDSDGDGISNLQEYIAGTYAFDDKDGFSLKIVRTEGENPVLEFLAIRGRTYAVYSSSDLQAWAPVEFRLTGTQAPILQTFYATDVRLIQIEALVPNGQGVGLYKLMVK